MTRTAVLLLLAVLPAPAPLLPPVSSHGAASRMPQCTQVKMSAFYLAEAAPGAGPGYLVVIRNDSSQAVNLIKPFPSSAHWYAEAPDGRWLWRASSGGGGALVDAQRPAGPVFSFAADKPEAPEDTLAIAPHSSLELAESIRDHPWLRFRPGCERCRNPLDAHFRTVLAYAYQPRSDSAVPNLLSCGLRSSPVVMPPLP